MFSELGTGIMPLAAGACIFAAYWLLCRMVGTGSYVNDVWVSYYDQRAFAGFFIAVDMDTRELLEAAPSYNALCGRLWMRPSRDCRVVHLPGVPCNEMAYLLSNPVDRT